MTALVAILHPVIPAQAGIHKLKGSDVMDSRLRGNDDNLLEGKS